MVSFMVMPDTSLSQQRRDGGMSFLGLDGEQKTSCDQATVFALQNAQLQTKGFFVSTSGDVTMSAFTVKSQLDSISKRFSVARGRLLWSNDAFDNGVASFCLQKGTVFVVFHGPPPIDCSPTALLATFGGMERSSCMWSVY